MLKRFKHNLVGTIGLAACLIFGGVSLVETYLRDREHVDLYSPIGMLAKMIASWFTSPPSLISAGSDRVELTYFLLLGARALIPLTFALLLWWRSHPVIKRSATLNNCLLALQMLLGLAELSPLLNVLAAEFALLLPLRKGLKWLATQLLLVSGLNIYFLLGSGLISRVGAMRMGLFYFGMELLFYVICFTAAYAILQERRGRIKLAASNAELQATQALLGDTVRASERIRIARDLHDIIGHHLTALNLHLDLALRQSDSSVPEGLTASLQTSRELASALLAEVRGVVSSERHEQNIDLRHALETLCAGIPTPAIHLEFDPTLEINSAVLAHTLFCCIQEAISNAVRHAGATQLTIAISSYQQGVQVLIADDGKGCADNQIGNGLRGMRERIQALGGQLSTGQAQQRGYALEICLPNMGMGVQR